MNLINFFVRIFYSCLVFILILMSGKIVFFEEDIRAQDHSSRPNLLRIHSKQAGDQLRTYSLSEAQGLEQLRVLVPRAKKESVWVVLPDSNQWIEATEISQDSSCLIEMTLSDSILASRKNQKVIFVHIHPFNDSAIAKRKKFLIDGKLNALPERIKNDPFYREAWRAHYDQLKTLNTEAIQSLIANSALPSVADLDNAMGTAVLKQVNNKKGARGLLAFRIVSALGITSFEFSTHEAKKIARLCHDPITVQEARLRINSQSIMNHLNALIIPFDRFHNPNGLIQKALDTLCGDDAKRYRMEFVPFNTPFKYYKDKKFDPEISAIVTEMRKNLSPIKGSGLPLENFKLPESLISVTSSK